MAVTQLPNSEDIRIAKDSQTVRNMSTQQEPDHTPYLSTRLALGLAEDASLNPFLQKMIEKAVGIDRLNQLMEEVGRPWPEAGPMIDTLFDRLNIKWSIENPELLEQFDDKPKVFVANHPYGLPDAFALFQLLTQYRSNIRIFANRLLAATKLDDPRLLFVDPFGSKEARGQTRKSIAEAMRHLRGGGDLALFPGRICSHLKTTDWTISDSDWTDQIRKFVEVSGGELVPLFISGRNSMTFNLSGLIHPRIRTYMLLREFLRGGHDFTFTIGDPVTPAQLGKVSRSLSAGNFARSMVYSLKTGSSVPDLPLLIQPELRSEEEAIHVERAPVATRGKRVKALLDQHETLFHQNGFTVFQAEPGASDEILDIICEIRFGAYATETTMTDPSQLRDRYDDFYHHLLLWDDEKKAVAGVYRYTLPDPATRPPTAENLVTSSIFILSREFEKLLPNAMELGRAAILPEYQKGFSPLMLLWRGFLEIPNRNKDIKYLFGPVTMGKTFTPVSRELVRRFIMRTCNDESMNGYVSPKRSLNFDIPKEVEIEKLDQACRSFSQLGNIIHGLEGGKRSLPVLFRHYANNGCKFIGFGEWKELDCATAGLTIVDFSKSDESRGIIQRHFGKEGADAFFAGR